MIQEIKIPIFPIGGINRKNLSQLIPLGVARAAVCRDILLAKDTGKAIEEFKQDFNL